MEAELLDRLNNPVKNSDYRQEKLKKKKMNVLTELVTDIGKEIKDVK